LEFQFPSWTTSHRLVRPRETVECASQLDESVFMAAMALVGLQETRETFDCLVEVCWRHGVEMESRNSNWHVCTNQGKVVRCGCRRRCEREQGEKMQRMNCIRSSSLLNCWLPNVVFCIQVHHYLTINRTTGLPLNNMIADLRADS
jgi:hypothetical protein